MPISNAGLIGIAVAAALLGVVAMMARPATPAAGRAVSNDLLPRTQAETSLFLGFAVAAGIGWELLY